MGQVYIGTSGWSYKSWEKRFYPAKLPAAQHFIHYATQFPTVEINLTFYRLPTPQMVNGWRLKAPTGFIYAVKGSRFITHMKKLVGVEEALERYFERIAPLRAYIGPILWQLPPVLQKDNERLEQFLSLLPREYRHAVEFRHPSWLKNDVYDLLQRHEAAFVSVSSLAMPLSFTTTTDFVYIRFHGLEGGAAHDYTQKQLTPWATHIRRQHASGRTVFVYFNNDANVCAPANAKMLMRMTGALATPALSRDPQWEFSVSHG